MKSENYSYNYKKLTRDEIETILSKKCNLTLRDYINVLNSTNNLRLLSLQQISNNLVCRDMVIKNISELLSLIHTVSGECIIKCINNKDWYRLVFINLKINELLFSMENTKLLFKRALTNGVYGAEYINIYLDDDLNERKSLLYLYEKIKNKSAIINRSRPQSVTSSLIYFFLCKKLGSNNVNIKDFIKKVKLSELTINKISKEIAKII
jgi:hypothetical protein